MLMPAVATIIGHRQLANKEAPLLSPLSTFLTPLLSYKFILKINLPLFAYLFPFKAGVDISKAPKLLVTFTFYCTAFRPGVLFKYVVRVLRELPLGSMGSSVSATASAAFNTHTRALVVSSSVYYLLLSAGG